MPRKTRGRRPSGGRAPPHHRLRQRGGPPGLDNPPTYKAGDTDLAWTRLTNWRIQLAAALDQVDGTPVTAVAVEGASDSPSTILLAAWLTLALDAPVTSSPTPPDRDPPRPPHPARRRHPAVRPGPSIAELTRPGQPAQRISLPRRSLGTASPRDWAA